MNGSHGMGVGQGIGNSCHQRSRHEVRQPADRDQVAQRVPVHEVTDNDGQTVNNGDLVNRDDAGMPKLGRRPGFAEEPRDFLTAFDQLRMRHLERDDPVQPSIQRTPDGPESTDADPLQELKFAELSNLVVLAGRAC